MSKHKQHRYSVKTIWDGARAGPARDYESYSRDVAISAEGKPPIPASSDPAFKGDPSRHNPEDMLVGALSACHMLWYLHLCTVKGVVVTGYMDSAEGLMIEEPRKGGSHRGRPAPRRHDHLGQRRGPGGNPARARPRGMLHRQLGELPGPLRADDRQRRSQRGLTFGTGFRNCGARVRGPDRSDQEGAGDAVANAGAPRTDQPAAGSSGKQGVAAVETVAITIKATLMAASCAGKGSAGSMNCGKKAT